MPKLLFSKNELKGRYHRKTTWSHKIAHVFLILTIDTCYIFRCLYNEPQRFLDNNIVIAQCFKIVIFTPASNLGCRRKDKKFSQLKYFVSITLKNDIWRMKHFWHMTQNIVLLRSSRRVG
jgi:hypothetical protein